MPPAGRQADGHVAGLRLRVELFDQGVRTETGGCSLDEAERFVADLASQTMLSADAPLRLHSGRISSCGCGASRSAYSRLMYPFGTSPREPERDVRRVHQPGSP